MVAIISPLYTLGGAIGIVTRCDTYTYQGKRLFIKDMAYYLMSPDDKPSQIAPSLGGGKEPGNPTVLPVDILKRFHFTFLIRHPKRSIPSYYRCTIPPLSEITGFDYFMPSEAGYLELVRLLDFLLERGIVDRDHITAIDADDLLDKPEPIIREYCARIGIDFKPEMLKWTEEDREYAQQMFAKWNGFHDDALKNSCFQARSHAQVRREIRIICLYIAHILLTFGK